MSGPKGIIAENGTTRTMRGATPFAEHCTGIAKIMGLNPVLSMIFFLSGFFRSFLDLLSK